MLSRIFGDDMLNKSVTVIDVRSSQLTAVVAERGVNGTFIIKSSFTSDYDGYAEGQMIDENSFSAALASVIKRTLSACGDKVRSVYVGVPGEFTRVVTTDNVISFPSRRKVSRADVRSLENASVPSDIKGGRLVRSACLYYVLSDMRRVVEPAGMLTDSLRGRMCHYVCDGRYCDLAEAALAGCGIEKVTFIPAIHAEAMYLLPPEKRDEYAVLFDFGFISSSYIVACGNGIAYSQSFSLGAGHLALYLSESLDMPFDAALAVLGKVNLNSRDSAASYVEHMSDGKLYKFAVSEVKEKLREALDGICETLEECTRSFTEKPTDGKTLYMTGESALAVRGAADHISGRMVRVVAMASPQIPYYDKPSFGPLFSLIDMALSDRENTSIFRFLGIFG